MTEVERRSTVARFSPDGLWLVCEGLNRDLEAISKHFLEVLARFQTTENK